MDSFHWWTFSEKRRIDIFSWQNFPKTQPCYSRNVWHIILKIYCQTLTVWGQIDKNINLLCSRPRVTWKYWDNKIQYCQTVRGGEGKYNFPHCHQPKFSYYSRNDIKSWIFFSFYEILARSEDRKRPTVFLAGNAIKVWNTNPDRADRLMLSRLSGALTLALFIGVVHVAR